MRRERVDVAIVGAGPAGASAALAALGRRPDAHVVLLDAAAFPRDKTCGDGIAPHALDVLAELGVTDLTAGYPPMPRLRLTGPGGASVERRPRRPNAVVPREVFDARLLDAARARGAELRRHRVRAVRLGPDGVDLDGKLAARMVVGADGATSAVRRAVARPQPHRHTALAIRGYAAAPAGPGTQVIRMTRAGWPAYAWCFPTGTGRANVGFGLLLPRLSGGRSQLLGGLAELVPDAAPDPATLRAHLLPFSSARPRQPDGPVLLAGDAASLVNPLTGEGIYYAVASGRLAGEAAGAALADRSADPGARYRRALDRLLGRHLRQTSAVSALARRPSLVDAAVRAAAGSGEVFDELVEMGLGRGMFSGPTLARVVREWARPPALRPARRAG